MHAAQINPGMNDVKQFAFKGVPLAAICMTSSVEPVGTLNILNGWN